MPSPKPGLLLGAAKMSALADDIAAGRVPADATAVEKMARTFADALRSIAAQWHS
jgi:hypothetical protein